MSKFVKKPSKKQPTVSTAALPDIVFMLLFFFMVAASIKSSNYEKFIKIDRPKATELTNINKPENINYIYIGQPQPKYVPTYGSEPLVVINDEIVTNPRSQVAQAVDGWVKKATSIKDIQTMLTIDKNINIGIVQDIKDELGRNKMQKVVYTAKYGDINENFQQQ